MGTETVSSGAAPTQVEASPAWVSGADRPVSWRPLLPRSGRWPGELVRRTNPQLLIALALTFVYHGTLLIRTFGGTYDAYIHIFFADHYARAWFDNWEPRWYT